MNGKHCVEIEHVGRMLARNVEALGMEKAMHEVKTSLMTWAKAAASQPIFFDHIRIKPTWLFGDVKFEPAAYEEKEELKEGEVELSTTPWVSWKGDLWARIKVRLVLDGLEVTNDP